MSAAAVASIAPHALTSGAALAIERLTVRYGEFVAAHDVSFEVFPGEVLGIVGESGSGKSTVLGACGMDLTPDSGTVHITGRDISELGVRARRRLHDQTIGVVRQHAADELWLDVSAGGNIAHRLLAMGHRDFADIRARAEAAYREVELPPERIDAAVVTFSGGMRQRVQIARAMVAGPQVLLLDEPTTGLDVSVQARILDLIRRLQRQSGVAMVVVSHDLAVIRMLADRLLVMHRGEVVEYGVTDRVLSDPAHPYTQLLVSSRLEA